MSFASGFKFAMGEIAAQLGMALLMALIVSLPLLIRIAIILWGSKK